MPLSVGQCRAARALLGWTIADLAEAAGVGVMTVNRFENGKPVNATSAEALERTLLAGGVSLIAAGDTSPFGGEGVRLLTDEGTK
ncbi:helix-turn-helix transcriptional regulator [uncultured Sphingomonas sp.]|uniref:helix-turn-helix domain-containing protein n=1 Tax=uncultured Sphingomonas sp. TaxID=158754 RepID=UPI0025DB98F5|nr:helix-turn-helix transcriptional regulator [uncultured Sphingomonas sp.]